MTETAQCFPRFDKNVHFLEIWWFFTAEKREEPWSLKRIVTRSFISMVTVAMFN